METKRLRIRRLTHSDLPQLMKIFSDPETMHNYVTTKTEEEAKEWIEWNHRNYKAYNVGIWAVEMKHNGEFVGQCGIVPQKINEEIHMELGYLFIRDNWGKGLATEAAQACMEYGFQVCKYPVLISLIDPENKPSIRVAKKIGMQKVGQVKKWNRTLEVYSISQLNTQNDR